jgi:hypothetical protein
MHAREITTGAGRWGKLAAEIAKNTRVPVKTQRTWFKTQLPAHRHVDAGEATAKELSLCRTADAAMTRWILRCVWNDTRRAVRRVVGAAT